MLDGPLGPEVGLGSLGAQSGQFGDTTPENGTPVARSRKGCNLSRIGVSITAKLAILTNAGVPS